MKDILETIMQEAKNGSITIDGDSFNLGFNTIITNKEETILKEVSTNDLPTLRINDYNLFLNLLESYINKTLQNERKIPTIVFDKEVNTIKMIIASLFFNLTPGDFSRPYHFLQKHIEFYENKLLLQDLQLNNIENFQNSNLILSNTKNSIMMETPYKVDIKFEKEGEYYNLPSIYYGIKEEQGYPVCYIYSILSEKNLTNTYQKKIKRLLYKVNDGIENPEVSPSAVLSLSIFLQLLNQKNITKVYGVPYLPIRYESRERAALNSKDEEKRKNLLERNQQIQINATDKFIKTFEAVTHLNQKLILTEIPFIQTDYIGYEINQNAHSNNETIEKITEKIR